MNIIFLKQGNLYQSKHANALASQLRNYYPGARYICYTEDPTGLYMEDIPFIPKPTLKKWWNKLSLFSDYFSQKVHGRCMLFDLDTMIAEDPGQYVKSWDKLHVVDAYWKKDKYLAPHSYDTRINSSVLTWTSGTQNHIWEHFMTNRDYFMRKYRGIDGFIFNEAFDYGLHHQGMLSRVESPLPMAAVRSWNNIDFNEISGLHVAKTVV